MLYQYINMHSNIFDKLSSKIVECSVNSVKESNINLLNHFDVISNSAFVEMPQIKSVPLTRGSLGRALFRFWNLKIHIYIL